jgi:hypothetical protein
MYSAVISNTIQPSICSTHIITLLDPEHSVPYVSLVVHERQREYKQIICNFCGNNTLTTFDSYICVCGNYDDLNYVGLMF